MKNWIIAGTTLLSGLAIKQLIKYGWEKTQDEPAPVNPASNDTTWGKAVAWTLTAAAVAGLSRLIIRKGLTEKLNADPKR